MIVALCTVAALLAAPSVGQGSGGSTHTSPCPTVFRYNGMESGSWYGSVALSTDILLDSMRLNIMLDSPASEVFLIFRKRKHNTTTQDNVDFRFESDNLQIHPDQPQIVRIFVQHDPINTPPRLRDIRFNGNVICNGEPLSSPQSDIYSGYSGLVNNSDAALNINTPNSTIECGVVAGGNERVPLINNGKFYERGEIPWLVAIYRVVEGTLLFICGGTLISDRHVVTAAHCMRRPFVVTPMAEIMVKVGVHSLNDWSDDLTVIRKLKARTIHEDYNPNTLQNDILILTLDERVQFNRYIRPACLWNGDTELSRVVGSTGVVAGWGDRSTEDKRGKLDEPQMLRIPIVSTKECRASKSIFHQLTYNTTLCAGDRNGTGPCKGDSGGGLYLLEGGKWRLRGVVSISLQNEALTCDLTEYVVFTDTAQFLPWIRNILSDEYFKLENRNSKPSVIADSADCGLVSGGNDRVTLSALTAYARGTIPWLTSLHVRDPASYSLKYMCGGTLVSDRHVVTTARFMYSLRSLNPIKDIMVKFGAHNVNDWAEDDIVTRRVSSVSAHADYNLVTNKNDILILTLNKRVQFNDYIRPACLWSGDTELSGVVGASGIVAGWGFQSENGPGFDQPHIMRATIVSNADCKASNPIFKSRTSDTTFCAGDRNGAAPCAGSSGAGFVLLEGGRWRLRGIISMGIVDEAQSCNNNEYVVYSDTAQLLPWIKNILLENYID